MAPPESWRVILEIAKNSPKQKIISRERGGLLSNGIVCQSGLSHFRDPLIVEIIHLDFGESFIELFFFQYSLDENRRKHFHNAIDG